MKKATKSKQQGVYSSKKKDVTVEWEEALTLREAQ
jgi:hypothetical protein